MATTVRTVARREQLSLALIEAAGASREATERRWREERELVRRRLEIEAYADGLTWEACGFDCEEDFVEHCAEHYRETFIDEEHPDLPETYWGTGATPLDVVYFASGSNHAGAIRGLADAGQHVGVAVNELDQKGRAERALVELARRTTLVFGDSGAFGEFMAEIRGTPARIADDEWARRLALYERLGAKLGAQLYAVAPDKVADQAATLQRLERYRDAVRTLAAQSVNVIVPVQKGDLAMAAFWRRAVEILDLPTDSLIAGLPMKADSTTNEAVAAFCAEAQPRRVHLLGLGPESGRFATVVRIVRAACGASVSADSVLVRRLAGKTNGPGKGPRPLTARRMELQRLGVLDERDLTREAVATTMLDVQARGESLRTARLRTDARHVEDAPVRSAPPPALVREAA